MTKLLKSDLFRHFMGGFILGAAALISLQPQSDRMELAQKMQTAVTHISGKLT